MNYQPYSLLQVGALCRDLDHADLLLVKTDVPNRAMVLRSVWIDNTLYPRGSTVEMERNECVVALGDDEAMEVTAARNDPIDPRRVFWQPGQQKLVGRDAEAPLNIFAGLFLYSGLGMGNYYSGVANEVFWCGHTEAQARAAEEQLPCVYHDSFQWTSDPDLTSERAAARTRFDAAKPAAVAKVTSATA